ncbi:hypothetical protein Lgee_0108 [Legionella geestiana]|uniref:Uncharacterized protein n=2 Tax=Legionella geestiana TaxID=45065 RepID=A0A0W0U954_9GAMM|nr:hypothetical protein Lgee_0108 [Legionella geestiana]STX52998.1 Uncharacterised protein [Legionella geestiana]
MGLAFQGNIMAASPGAFFANSHTVFSIFLPGQPMEVGQAIVKITFQSALFNVDRDYGAQLFIEEHVEAQKRVYSGSVICDTSDKYVKEQRFLDNDTLARGRGILQYDQEYYFLLSSRDAIEAVYKLAREQSALTETDVSRRVNDLLDVFLENVRALPGAQALTSPPPARGCECVIL